VTFLCTLCSQSAAINGALDIKQFDLMENFSFQQWYYYRLSLRHQIAFATQHKSDDWYDKKSNQTYRLPFFRLLFGFCSSKFSFSDELVTLHVRL
jgi:hypothetical protein